MGTRKITEKQLSDTLIDLIKTQKNTLGFFKNNVEIITEVSEVTIGINGYNKDTDLLMVFRNSTYCELGIEYTISSDSLKINKVEGTWNGAESSIGFNFIVLKNIPNADLINASILADGSLTLNKLETALQTNINKIPDIESSLADIVQQKISCILPEYFGCKGDGTTDDTIALQNAINYAISNKVLLSSSNNKVYAISSQLNITGYIDIDFNDATIKATKAINIFNFNMVGGHEYSGTIKNLILDCNNIATIAINIPSAHKMNFSHIEIKNISGTGIYNCTGNYELFFDNIHLNGSAITAIGIYTNASDCHYTDIVGIDINIFIKCISASNFFTRCHAWISTPIYLVGSCYMDITNGIEYLNQCYVDTYATAFKITNGTEMYINELSLFHNISKWTTDLITQCDGVYVLNFVDSSAESGSIIYIRNSRIWGLLLNLVSYQQLYNYNTHNNLIDESVTLYNNITPLNMPNGWIEANETWVYASVSSFTVNGNVGAKYRKGDKIKLTSNSAILYGYVSNVTYDSGSNTSTVNILGNNLTNYTFSQNCYSKSLAPHDFPQWFSYSSAIVWTTATPIGIGYICRYKIQGNTLFLKIKITGTDGNGATGLSAYLPFLPANVGFNLIKPITVTMNGGQNVRYAQITESTGRFDTSYLGTLTTGQSFAIYGDFSYEI